MSTTLVRLPFGMLANKCDCDDSFPGPPKIDLSRPLPSYRYGYRAAYLLTYSIALLGNALYVVAILGGQYAVLIIFLARLFAGCLGTSQNLMNRFASWDCHVAGAVV